VIFASARRSSFAKQPPQFWCSLSFVFQHFRNGELVAWFSCVGVRQKGLKGIEE